MITLTILMILLTGQSVNAHLTKPITKTLPGCCGRVSSQERHDPDWKGDPDDNLTTVYGFDATGNLEIHVNAGKEQRSVVEPGNYITADSGASWKFLPANLPGAGNRTGRSIQYRTSPRSGGIYERSEDGGHKWTPLEARLVGSNKQLYLLQLVTDPITPEILYAQACVEQDCSVRSPSFGVYQTTDRGQSFSIFRKDLIEWPKAFAINPLRNSIIYAVDKSGNLIKTNNRGANWERIHDSQALAGGYTLFQQGKKYRIDQNHIWQILLDTKNPNVIYVISSKGLIKSDNGGLSWCIIAWETHDGYTVTPVSLAIDPSDSNILFAGTFYGLFKSSDQGCTWNKIDIANGIINK